ncbi:MAG TPA: hypothetical protein VJM31_02290 [Vicinamibacterales bacterium]|nr:hypothetical protein [Vicinamibacterales bacterium]
MSTIWSFKSGAFSVELSWDYETDYDHSWADAETLEKLASGEWTSYQFKVAVIYRGEEIAADYLGDSIHADPRKFIDHRECGRYNRELAAKGVTGRYGSYFHDMVREAIREARKVWNEPRPRLRAV